MRTREQQNAHAAVSRALKRGVLTKPDRCEHCGQSKRLGAHHHNGYDNSHQLDVQWLCGSCHVNVHGNPAAGGRAASVNGGHLGKIWAGLNSAERSIRASELRHRSSAERRSEIARKGHETRRQRMSQGVIYKSTRPKWTVHEEVMPT